MSDVIHRLSLFSRAFFRNTQLPALRGVHKMSDTTRPSVVGKRSPIDFGKRSSRGLSPRQYVLWVCDHWGLYGFVIIEGYMVFDEAIGLIKFVSLTFSIGRVAQCLWSTFHFPSQLDADVA